MKRAQLKLVPARVRPMPDRLGDAIRELARTLAEHGQDRLVFQLVHNGEPVTYEVRRLDTGGAVIEVEAFGPEPHVSQASRQMAESEKE